MSKRNTLEAKRVRREARKERKAAFSDSHFLIPLRRPDRNKYSFVDGVVTAAEVEVEEPTKPKVLKRIFGPKDDPS
jgi:hypothetical protein